MRHSLNRRSVTVGPVRGHFPDAGRCRLRRAARAERTGAGREEHRPTGAGEASGDSDPAPDRDGGQHGAADHRRGDGGRVVDARVLIITGDGTDSGLDAIQSTLQYLGTPFDVFNASTGPTLTADMLATGRTASTTPSSWTPATCRSQAAAPSPPMSGPR